MSDFRETQVLSLRGESLNATQRPKTWREAAVILDSPTDYTQLRKLDLSAIKKKELLELTGDTAHLSLTFLSRLGDIDTANRYIVAEAIGERITTAPWPNTSLEEYHTDLENTVRNVLRAGLADELREKSPYLQLIQKVEVGDTPEEVQAYYRGVLSALELNEWREPGDGYRKPKEAFALCPDMISHTVSYFQTEVGPVITGDQQHDQELHRILAHYEIEAEFAAAS
jgi:hypothetical protein